MRHHGLLRFRSGNDFREIGRTTVRYRFIDFSRCHTRQQVTRLALHCQPSVPHCLSCRVERSETSLNINFPLQKEIVRDSSQSLS